MHTRLVFLLVVVGAAACAMLQTREDLDIAMGKHHIDLRWGRLENAAMKVKLEMRGDFLKSWVERLQVYEVHDLEVAGVVMDPDGNTARVVVSVTMLDKNTMTVKNATLQETWVRVDDGWYASEPAKLP